MGEPGVQPLIEQDAMGRSPSKPPRGPGGSDLEPSRASPALANHSVDPIKIQDSVQPRDGEDPEHPRLWVADHQTHPPLTRPPMSGDQHSETSDIEAVDD